MKFEETGAVTWQVWFDGYRDRTFETKQEAVEYCKQIMEADRQHLFSIYKVQIANDKQVMSLVDQYYPIEKLL